MSRLCEEIDERVEAFLTRPIEGQWVYLWIEATYLRVCQGGRIVSVAVTIAVGVNTDGRREVLGMAVGPSEAETFWTGFLRDLLRKGGTCVKRVISDAHDGIKASVARVLQTSWQRCRGHFQRNVLADAGKSSWRLVSAFIATAFAQADYVSARTRLAPCRRSHAADTAKARRVDGRGRRRRPRLHDVPTEASREAPQYESH